jgi:hypothetical protein
VVVEVVDQVIGEMCGWVLRVEVEVVVLPHDQPIQEEVTIQ